MKPQNQLSIKFFLTTICLAVFLPVQIFSQPRKVIDLNNIFSDTVICTESAYAFVAENILPSGFKTQKLENLQPGGKIIATENVSKKILLKFTAGNSATQTENFYFFPFVFFKDCQLYEENKATGNISIINKTGNNPTGYYSIKCLPNDTAIIYALITQERTYTSRLKPFLVRDKYQPAFASQLKLKNFELTTFTYVFCGLFIMMMIFSVANYLMGGSREFLYYALYSLLTSLMLFTKAHFYFEISPTSAFWETYLDFILQGVGICFYMFFMMRFLETKKEYPALNALYKYGIISVIIALIIYSWLHYSNADYYYQYLVENITKYSLIVLMIIFLVISIKYWGVIIFRYLFWGNFLYLLFGIISQLRIDSLFSKTSTGLFSHSLTYYETGMFFELIFFLAALAYKNRHQIIYQTREKERLLLENERGEFEKQMAVMEAHQEERNRISADMHDELGSGMTTIRLMSEIAKNKMKDAVPVEIEKISNSANDLLNKMNAIIWSMNSVHDTVDNLISYIRAYSIEFFDGMPINCKVNTPKQIPAVELSGDKRRNLFLCVKETLNNILKHSKATELLIDIKTSDQLEITITDNGVGINMEKIREFGNGLNNIKRRMKNIGGNFTIENNNGTITTLTLPL